MTRKKCLIDTVVDGWKEIQKTAAEQRKNQILCIEKRQMRTDEKEN